MDSRLENIGKNQEEFKKSLEYYGNKIDDFNLRISEVENRIKAIPKLENSVSTIASDLEKTNREIELLQQQARRNNVEINGIPEKSGENLQSVLVNILKALNIPENCFETYHRVAHIDPDNKNPRSIIVKMISIKEKNDLLASIKNKQGLKLNQAGLPGDGNIYINDHLTIVAVHFTTVPAGRNLKMCKTPWTFPDNKIHFTNKQFLYEVYYIMRSGVRIMSSNWFGQNWQQDQGPMDHDVSHPSNFMGIVPIGNNSDSGDDISYSYKLLGQNMTLDHCEKMYINETKRLLKTHPDGFCNTSFDKILCWPPTPYNSVARIKCFSEFLGITYDDTQNATRECSYNGTWHKSTYDDCTELEMYPTSVETQTNIYLIGYIISSVTLAIAIFIFTYFKDAPVFHHPLGGDQKHPAGTCT
ncbi:unnamed protein product [Ceutorhynchus assimilis]|uniref:G-protein coupled receptors family 2 profile 1 domain-containing protein n=1 Tax=Ceutorhynchus assimilis TaxID=467358 RepID=A0A9N9N0N2_9CUCU|nr:unnamed protein product [Ceutorhynchus assimilis]